jgi:hypothetical protein
MSEIIERVAAAMYWQTVERASPDAAARGATVPWAGLPDDRNPVLSAWFCRRFWRDAARAAIKAVGVSKITNELLAALRGMEALYGNQYNAEYDWKMRNFDDYDQTEEVVAALAAIESAEYFGAMIDEALK